jgi:hypothetical protein
MYLSSFLKLLCYYVIISSSSFQFVVVVVVVLILFGYYWKGYMMINTGKQLQTTLELLNIFSSILGIENRENERNEFKEI